MSTRVASPAFVGRAHELGVLQAARQRALGGEPGAVLIAGEAGVGKTRLVREFHDAAGRAGAWTLLGRCIPTRDGIAFAPVVEVLRRLSRELQPAMFDHLVGGARHELARLVPELAPGSAPAPPVDPGLGWTRGRLFELVLGFLGRLAREACVVLTVEDLHWSDRSTQDLVSFLVRELDDERVLLVGTYRTDELGAGHPVSSLAASLLESGRARRVVVGRFDRAETAEQVTAILGGPAPPGLVDRIHDRSEGNAFFTEELLAAADDEQRDLPATIRDTLRARVAALSELAIDVLRVAAVAGRQVDHSLLSAASAMAEPELTVALREAVDRHMLIPDADSYTFRHPLLRETVYQLLLPGERRALHEAYARALTQRQERTGTTDVAAVAELAHHWREAGDVEAALVASFRAARTAMASFAFAEAHFEFERVIELWRQVPDAADEVGATVVDVFSEAADAANHRGDHDRAITLLRRALEHVDVAADAARTSLLQGRLAHYLWESGELPASFEAAELAARTAPAAPPSVARARALTALARTRLLTGRLADGRALAEQALEAAVNAGARRDESTARQVLGLILVLLGEPDAGIEHLEAAHRLAIDVDHVEEIAASTATLAVALTGRGRLRTAESRLRAVTELARERGFARSYGLWLTANHAWVLYKLGAWTQAELLAREVADPRHTATQVALRLSHLVLGQLATGRGDLTAARAHLGTARQLTARQWIDHVPAAMAELELWADRPDRARAAVADGLAAVPQGNEIQSDAAMLCWLGIRAEAERAEGARPLADRAALDDATATATALLSRCRSIAPRGQMEITLATALAEAEHTRVHAAPRPDLWEDAARRARDLEQPVLRAYALWRQAGACLLTQGDRDEAVAALRTAHDIAAALGARPLAGGIAQLARFARVPLTARAPADDEPAQPASAAARIGLTPREIDVLTLVAQGRTNTQIGEALFISDKTASVHVSHILTKLGAANRVEAAGIAHRLRLVDPAP